MRAFETRYSDHIKVVELVGHRDKLIIDPRLSLHDLLNSAYRQKVESKTTLEPTSDEKIQEAAAIVATDVQDNWKPAETYDLSAESIQRSIPHSLMLLVTSLFSSANQPAQVAICQDLIAQITRRTPPKHITLASSIHHLTGSKVAIDLLNKLGHCCSYTELQRLYTGSSMSELNRAKEIGAIIPKNILPGSLGLIQAAADDDDFQVDTRDGNQSTHGTTMMLLQHRSQFGAVPELGTRTKTRRTSLESDEFTEFFTRTTISLPKKVEPPSVIEARAIRVMQRDFLQDTTTLQTALKIDQEWVLTRLAPTKLFDLQIQPSSQTCPSWSAYNARQLTADEVTVATVGYCPMWDHNPNDPSTIYTVLTALQHMMNQLNQTHSVITFDLALYKIAKEIQWNRPREFEHTIIHLGGFHIAMNYLAALGTMRDTSGLRELLVDSGLFSEVVANQVLRCKHYNRAILAHKLLYETMMRKKLEALGEWMQEEERDDPLETESQNNSQTDQILGQLEDMDTAKGSSTMYQFWNHYIKSVSIVLSFIRSERTGNWQLYLDSMMAMLPVFSAYDRNNYSRWLPVYLSDMITLEDTAPQVHGEFVQGKFSINRTGKSFAGVSVDQVLEQTLNRDSKSSSGLVGISNNEEARNKWFFTTHIRAHLLGLQRDLCEVKSENPSAAAAHKEDRSPVTMKDEASIQAILATLERFEVNPFRGGDLTNLATGIKPSKDGATHISSAPTIGRDRATEFIQERLASTSKSTTIM